MDLSQYDISQATHDLKCVHKVGRSPAYRYTMPCIVLGKTPSYKTKIVVFGDRYWKNKDHIKRIRYVTALDIIERKTKK